MWLAATAATGVSIGWLRPDEALAGGTPGSLDTALSQGATLVATGCLGWVWLVTGLTVLEAVELRARGRVACPAGLRRLVLVACGAALAGGVVVPAQAADPTGEVRDRGSLVVSGLSLPERTFGGTRPPQPAEVSRVAAPRPAIEEVVVTAGDSLWSMASRLLPATAADSEIDALWRRIYAANQDRIGDDPGLIRPGQHLVVPESLR